MTVLRATPRSDAITRVDGRRVPGRSRPVSMAWRNASNSWR